MLPNGVATGVAAAPNGDGALALAGVANGGCVPNGEVRLGVPWEIVFAGAAGVVGVPATVACVPNGTEAAGDVSVKGEAIVFDTEAAAGATTLYLSLTF